MPIISGLGRWRQGNQEFNVIFGTEFQNSLGYKRPCLQRKQQKRQNRKRGEEKKWRNRGGREGKRRRERRGKKREWAGEENKALMYRHEEK